MRLASFLVLALGTVGCGGGGTFIPRDLGGNGNGDGGGKSNDMAGTNPNADLSGFVFPGDDMSMAQSGVPTSIVMYTGDGSVAVEQWPGGDPLRVLLTDGNGAPVVNYSVDWSYVSGAIQLPGNMDQSSVTDGNGIASMMFRGAGFDNTMPYSLGVIRAKCAAGSVDFNTLTIHTTNLGALNPLTSRISPDTTDLGSNKSGSTLAMAMKYQIVINAGNFNNTPLPGVGLWTLNSQDPEMAPPVTCHGYSDNQGFVACNAKFGTSLGQQFFSVEAGGYTRFDGWMATITP
jgi:hypothetical protein